MFMATVFAVSTIFSILIHDLRYIILTEPVNNKSVGVTPIIYKTLQAVLLKFLSCIHSMKKSPKKKDIMKYTGVGIYSSVLKRVVRLQIKDRRKSRNEMLNILLDEACSARETSPKA